MADLWSWRVIYSDGTTLEELDPHGDHSWADVDLASVVAVMVLPLQEGLPKFGILRRQSEQVTPVFFRRVTTPWLLGAGVEVVMHCLGLEWADGHASYTFWDDQGQVLVTGDKNAIIA